MIDPKMQAEIEQDSSGITEMIAMLFRNLVNEGFSHAQALTIACRINRGWNHKAAVETPIIPPNIRANFRNESEKQKVLQDRI